MKVFTISLILLLFETNVFGYSIPTRISKLEDDIKHNETEVYEMQEANGKTIKLIYPKADKPTLTEIIYFHVIETPFEDGKKPMEEGPDFDDTRRPFTNSHGLPFIKDETQTVEEEIVEETVEETDEDLVEETILEDESDDVKNEKNVENVTDKDLEEEMQVPESTSVHSETTATEQIPEDFYTTVKDDVVEEKKNARNLLFGQMKKRYEEGIKRPSTSSKPNRRQRRNVDHIPEAPKLEEMNFENLPEDVRKLISTPKPEKQEEPHKDKKHFNEQEFKKEMKDKIDSMISKLKNMDDDIILNIDEDDDDDDDGFDSSEYLKPRTYGMNLTKDHGHVWNDLFVPIGLSFEVGDSPDGHEPNSEANHGESDQGDDDTDSGEINDNEEEYEHTHYVTHPTESRPLTYQDNNKHEETEKETHGNADENDEFDDIFINKSKTLLEVTEDDKKEKQVKAVTPETEKELETSTEKETPRPKYNTEDSKEEIDHRKEELRIKDKDKFSNHPDLLDELMKNEQFWKWLSQWTDTYMELLMKYIKQMVHDEVGRQMKKYGKELKKEIQEEHERLLDQIHKLEDEERDKIKGEKEKEEFKAKDKKKESKAAKESKKDHKKNNKVDTEKLEPIMTDNKIIIDGVEIPITHNSNFKNEDSKDHHKHEKEDKHKHKEDKDRHKESDPIKKGEEHKAVAPISTIAHNIFGNSVGSEKVTNVYIFMQPDDDENEEFEDNGDAEYITDNDDESSGIDIDDRFKLDIDQQKDKEIKSTTPKIDVKDENSQTDNKEEKDKKEQNAEKPENEEDTKNSSKKDEKLNTSEKPLESTAKLVTEKTEEPENKDDELEKEENKSDKEGNESDKEENKLDKESNEKIEKQNEKPEISEKTENAELQESTTEKHEDQQ